MSTRIAIPKRHLINRDNRLSLFDQALAVCAALKLEELPQVNSIVNERCPYSAAPDMQAWLIAQTKKAIGQARRLGLERESLAEGLWNTICSQVASKVEKHEKTAMSAQKKYNDSDNVDHHLLLTAKKGLRYAATRYNPRIKIKFEVYAKWWTEAFVRRELELPELVMPDGL